MFPSNYLLSKLSLPIGTAIRLLGGCLLMLLLNSLAAENAMAGCSHASADLKRLNADGVDPSLEGKWQYVAGKTYYLFHPAPVPCDGPKCRPTPPPVKQMSTSTTTLERSMPIACSDRLSTPEPTNIRCRPTSTGWWPISPELAGLLRPPQAI